MDLQFFANTTDDYIFGQKIIDFSDNTKNQFSGNYVIAYDISYYSLYKVSNVVLLLVCNFEWCKFWTQRLWY